MRKLLRPFLAMSLVAALCAGAASAAQTGYGNTSYGTQMSFDSFNLSVRKRLETVRIGANSLSYGGSYSGGGGGASSGYSNPGQSYGGAPGYANPGQSYGGAPGFDQGYQGYAPTPAPAAPGYNQNPAGYAPAPGYNGGYNNNLNTNYNPNNFGSNGYSYNASAFSSDGAYAMAPSSRASSVASARRRQLDCVYYSGFTLWGDLYQTWARQSSNDGVGYRYRTFGPALGLDWTSGGFTLGAATTYNWGKLDTRDVSHDLDIETWALNLYGQYNADSFYANASLGYSHNKVDSDYSGNDEFTTNAFNIQGEFGWKLNFGGFQLTPNAGIRYFHDRRGSINDGGFAAGAANYHVIEVPIGVNFAYEINTGGMVFVPRARFAWVPELERNRDAAKDENAADRAQNGFNAGLGVEARFTDTLSAHLDYNLNFRSRQYEHHWNLGMGFSF